MLSALGLNVKSTVVGLGEPSPTFEASGHKLPGVVVLRSESVNVYDLLRHESVLMTNAARNKILGRSLAVAGSLLLILSAAIF